MAQSSQPTQVIHLGGFPTSPAACRLASGAHSGQSKAFCHAECLNEEPDVGKPLVRFCEGLRHNRCRAEILWHRRETRRQTENTNVMPIALEGLILLDKNLCRLTTRDPLRKNTSSSRRQSSGGCQPAATHSRLTMTAMT